MAGILTSTLEWEQSEGDDEDKLDALREKVKATRGWHNKMAANSDADALDSSTPPTKLNKSPHGSKQVEKTTRFDIKHPIHRRKPLKSLYQFNRHLPDASIKQSNHHRRCPSYPSVSRYGRTPPKRNTNFKVTINNATKPARGPSLASSRSILIKRTKH